AARSSRRSRGLFLHRRLHQLFEKDNTIKNLKQNTRAEMAAIRKQFEAEKAVRDADHTKLLARLQEAEDRESAARQELATVSAGYQGVMLIGQSRVYSWINLVQIAAGALFIFLAASTAFTLLGVEPPAWANYGATVLGLYGIVTAIQALRGRSLWGLSHLSRWLGRAAFLKYCTQRGVPFTVAQDRLTIDNGRVYLKSTNVKTLAEPDD
ncbi:hypothetical protein, partial [Phaeovulum sp.]|uniref:hypothetical protein n=1 Tax=Phaeovulum sp. TaxID=2934796 RepID=UPI0039E39B2A